MIFGNYSTQEWHNEVQQVQHLLTDDIYTTNTNTNTTKLRFVNVLLYYYIILLYYIIILLYNYIIIILLY